MVEVAENLLADPRTSFLGRLEAVVLVLLAFDVGCEVQMSRFAVLLQRSHYELFGLDSTGLGLRLHKSASAAGNGQPV